MNFRVDIDKAIEASLFILNRLKSCDIHKLFKVLYFSDKDHLSQYGRPITCDYYVAMKHGPVPSFVYDVVKNVRGDNSWLNIDRDVNSAFEVVDRMYVGSKRDANLDHLSESDIECLERSIEKYKDLDFDSRSDLSHDSAWNNANRNEEINVLDIANAAGADIEMLKYIQVNMENQRAFLCP